MATHVPQSPEESGQNASLLVQTRGLTKRYGGLTAVDDLDLSVRRGEVYGFLGPNGAGKTTTGLAHKRPSAQIKDGLHKK